MAYQQLILCVDVSGSMAVNNKITDAMKYLNKIVFACKCHTAYFKFNTQVHSVPEYTLSTLKCEGGTSIESCLNDLYRNHLRRFRASRSKFIFVTDAEDKVKYYAYAYSHIFVHIFGLKHAKKHKSTIQIESVSGVQSAKRQCESAFGNNLYSYCLLVGGSGGCSSELRQIFGRDSFDQVTDGTFETVLKRITGNVKTFTKVAVQHTNVESVARVMKRDVKEVAQKAKKEMSEVKANLDILSKESKEAEVPLNTAKSNLQELEQEVVTLEEDVEKATGDEEVDAVEEKLESAKDKFIEEDKKLTDVVGKKINKAEAEGKKAVKKQKGVAVELKQHAKKLGKQAEKAVIGIKQGMDMLDKLENAKSTGVKKELSNMKQAFNKALDELGQAVRENAKIDVEVRETQKEINTKIKEFKRQKMDYDSLRKNVLENMTKINELMKKLDKKG